MEIEVKNRETAERSQLPRTLDAALKLTSIRMQPIEGVSQDDTNVVTHILERRRCSIAGQGRIDEDSIREAVIRAEGRERMHDLLAFTERLGLPLHYVLYDPQHNGSVLLLRWARSGPQKSAEMQVEEVFSSTQAFAARLQEIKGWASNKAYEHPDDLPVFDQRLRQFGTPWPTNLDGVFFDSNGVPRGLLELQNTRSVPVRQHCNNTFFWGVQRPQEDVRRWLSQEILRVQAKLPLVVLVWSAKEASVRVKVIRNITFPHTGDDQALQALGKANRHYLAAMVRSSANSEHRERTKRDRRATFHGVAEGWSSYTLSWNRATERMDENTHEARLSVGDGTFPMIYYEEEQKVFCNDGRELAERLERIFLQ